MSADAPTHSPPARRHIDRRQTAEFIALSDVAIAIVVLGTLQIRHGGSEIFSQFPWCVSAWGALVLVLRMLLLLTLSGSMRTLIAGIAIGLSAAWAWLCRTITDNRISPLPAHWAKRWLAVESKAIYTKTRSWYSLIGLGILALVVVVAGSGGMAKSPFAQVLIGTFILGQFRAPTEKGIWALFGLGLGAAAAAHGGFVALLHLHPRGWDKVVFHGGYHVAPGFVVFFASTLVYWLTFRADIESGDVHLKHSR